MAKAKPIPLPNKPTLTESIDYFRAKVSKPRVEFLAIAQSKGAITMEDVALEIHHLSNIEAACVSYRNFIDGEPQS